jgi:alkylated DNA repair dioxygenase AlkB
MRVYKRGDRLSAHTDRPACEVSVTLALGYDAFEAWPFYLQGYVGTEEVILNRGDAMIYRGIDCMHWRDVFDGSYAAQVFLHYVDQAGPNAGHRFDGRRQLNYPRVER